jgi:hypothetical protein
VSIAGCYAQMLGNDVYTLNITSAENGVVSGTVAFNNYEKDSSSGTFAGTYENGILLGDYTFDSEGMHSVRQLVFKKVPTGFIEGFGGVTVTDNREALTDPASATFDPKNTFTPSDVCK